MSQEFIAICCGNCAASIDNAEQCGGDKLTAIVNCWVHKSAPATLTFPAINFTAMPPPCAAEKNSVNKPELH